MNRLLTAACTAQPCWRRRRACSLTESNEPSSSSGGSGNITVESSEDACRLTSDKAPSGNVAFKVKNTGSDVTEFYLYAEDGMRIVGEIENVGPGLSRDLVVRAAPGSYVTSCRPGMSGKGIRSDFTVTDSGKDTKIKGVDQDDHRRGHQPVRRLRQGPGRRSSSARPRRSPPPTRPARTTRPGRCSRTPASYWERIETVAESFGDLDPKMDLREADLEEGQRWTGWHRIEKDLWPPASGLPAAEAGRAGDVRR